MQLPKRITVAIRQIPNAIEAIMQEDGTYKFFGFDGRYLGTVLEKFGTPFDIIVPEDNIFGEERSDGNWTGVLGLVQKGEADIASCLLAPTYERLKAFDFSNGYLLGYITFAMKRPQNLPVANAFLYAFTKTLWLSLIFIILLFILIYYLLPNKEYNVMRLCLEMVSSAIRQPMKIRMQSLKERIMFGSWLVFVLVISLAYTQVLLSQAALPPEGKLFKTLKELLEAVKMKKLKVYKVDGSYSQGLLKNSPQPFIRELFEIITQNHWLINRSLDEYMNLLDKGHAVIGGNAFLNFPYGDSKELFMSEDTLLTTTAAMAFSKNFCCKKRVNHIINQLWGSNILHQFVNEQSYLTHMKKRKSSVSIEAVHPIQLGEIFGVFFILMIGYLMSLITLLAELIIFRGKLLA